MRVGRRGRAPLAHRRAFRNGPLEWPNSWGRGAVSRTDSRSAVGGYRDSLRAEFRCAAALRELSSGRLTRSLGAPLGTCGSVRSGVAPSRAIAERRRPRDGCCRRVRRATGTTRVQSSSSLEGSPSTVRLRAFLLACSTRTARRTRGGPAGLRQRPGGGAQELCPVFLVHRRRRFHSAEGAVDC